MKRAAYPKYKESGVPWLGEVPDGWEVSPIKFLVATPVTDGPHETPEIFNEGIPFVSAEAICGGIINFNKIRGHISEEDHKKFSKKYKPKLGDIYMVKSGATTGRIAMVETDIEFNIWSPLAAIRCNSKLLDRHFLYFYLQSKEFQTGVELSWSFGTQQNIGMGVIQNLAVPVPTLPVQTAIANFLDCETGSIDTLVEKKRALISLLKEKRTALISRTVTRGLPADIAHEVGLEPHTRFKDSGIEWLGEVPDGWEVKQLKWAIMFQRGHDLPADEREEGTIPLVTSAGISATHSIAVAKGPGIVTGRYGTIGEFYLIEQDYWPLNTTLYSITTRGNDPAYLRYMLSHLKPLFLLNAVKSAVPGIDRNDIHTTKTAIPPFFEQTAIATYLDRETAKLDKLVDKVEAAIARLQEYRTALITAAVTGKIDVRSDIPTDIKEAC